MKKAFSLKVLELKKLRYHVKTPHERCGPFSLVVLSQRRGRVTTLSGSTLSETLSSLLKTKLSQNYSTLTQVRSRTGESKLTLHGHSLNTITRETTPREPKFHTMALKARDNQYVSLTSTEPGAFRDWKKNMGCPFTNQDLG